VVVKVLRPGHLGDLEGLHREAEMLRALAHPTLVRAFGEQLDGERPHLVLEHIDGPRWISGRALSATLLTQRSRRSPGTSDLTASCARA
jgi:hypothetical protein